MAKEPRLQRLLETALPQVWHGAGEKALEGEKKKKEKSGRKKPGQIESAGRKKRKFKNGKHKKPFDICRHKERIARWWCCLGRE